MAGTDYVGLMAVFAVSSSVALVALGIQNHLTSKFLEKVQQRIDGGRHCDQRNTNPKKKKKKKVRFAVDVVQPSCNNEEYRKLRGSRKKLGPAKDIK